MPSLIRFRCSDRRGTLAPPPELVRWRSARSDAFARVLYLPATGSTPRTRWARFRRAPSRHNAGANPPISPTSGRFGPGADHFQRSVLAGVRRGHVDARCAAHRPHQSGPPGGADAGNGSLDRIRQAEWGVCPIVLPPGGSGQPRPGAAHTLQQAGHEETGRAPRKTGLPPRRMGSGVWL